MTIAKFAHRAVIFLFAACLFLLMSTHNAQIAQALETEGAAQTDVGTALSLTSNDDAVLSTQATDNATGVTLFGFKYNQTEARTMLDLVNKFRTSESWQWNDNNTQKVKVPAQPALQYDAKLEQAAMQRAAELAIRYSHTRPDDSTGSSVCKEVGYNYTAWGENIAFGYKTVADMFEGWKEENDNYAGQGHRRNMQSSYFNTIGIASVEVGGMKYWAMELGHTDTVSTPGNAFDGTRSASMRILNDKITGRSLTVSPSSLELILGETKTLPTVSISVNVKKQYVSGDYWNYTGDTYYEPVTPTWTTENGSIASIANGSVKAEAVGTTKLTASASGMTANVPVTVWKDKPITMYRLYNPNSGEHLYTKDQNEYKVLATMGWKQEGDAWQSPANGAEVYRLYNPNSGDHHYTTDANEYQALGKIGWKQEGVAWYSGGSTQIFRLFNPNVTIGTHHYTKDQNEYNTLQTLGWKAEGVGWNGI